MKEIYTITTLKTIYGYRNPAHTYELGCRSVGFYFRLDEATDNVVGNACDIYEEGYYPFCVIEKTYEGIYGCSLEEHWFQWIDDGYKPIEKPKELNNICGFGLG